MSDFSSWWKQYSTEHVGQYTKDRSSYYYLAEQVWNHQQAKIDELKAKLERLTKRDPTSGYEMR